MAERQKESSSADPKGKSSLLDEEIGREFLSSWKSMSMADDDAMDFSFDTVSNSEKKGFRFEKLDMDFNLDGEFDKISSFKVDLSDLDFTCPPKRSAKSNEKNGDSSGTKAGKQDGFNFSFDFNKFDGFNLDSTLINGDETSNSSLNKKGVTTNGSDCEGVKKPKLNRDENVCASNDSTATKPLTSEKLETSKVENLAGNLGDLSSRQDDSVSKFSSSANLDMSIEDRTSDICKIISAEEMDQESDLPEKTKSRESKPQQVINSSPFKSVAQNVLKQDTIPEQHTEVFPSGTKIINVSGGKPNANDNKATQVDSDAKDLQLEHSSPLHTKFDSSDGEAIKLSSSTQAGVTNNPQPVKIYTGFEDSTTEDNTTTGTLKISRDNDIRENQKSTWECHLSPASSEPVVDKTMLMKDKELQGRQSKIVSRPQDKSTLKHPSLTAGTKGIPFGCKIIGDMHLRSITKARCVMLAITTIFICLSVVKFHIAFSRGSSRSNDSEIGNKLVIDSLPGSSKLVTDAPALLDGKNDVKSCISREGIVSEGKPLGGKLAGNMQSFHKEVNKSKAMLLDTGMLAKDVNMLSSLVNPSTLTEKTAQNTTQMSVNSQADVSGKEFFQKSRITSIEGNKTTSVKAGKIPPAVYSFKTLRNIGANKVLENTLQQKETKVLENTLQQKETNSSVNSEQNVKIRGTTDSKNDHLIDSTDNQKPLTPSLKRKIIEVSNADLLSLRSLKRLSQSPSKSRGSIECSEIVVEQLESRPNNLLYNHSTSGPESLSEIKLTEVEIPDSVFMEDNSNVEKVEAYTKELEDICNMLKKKHEEAKELFVRAIMNNNNLQMLNHAIYEEKIQKAQKFALLLMSKGIQT